MPVILLHGMSGWAPTVSAETLPAASPITFRDRIAAFWCSRLLKNYPGDEPTGVLCGLQHVKQQHQIPIPGHFRTASTENGLGFGQNVAAAEIVAVHFYRLARQQIDRSSEEFLQRFFKTHVKFEIVSRAGRERDKQVDVAALGIEIVAARGRPENLQTGDAITSTQGGNLGTLS